MSFLGNGFELVVSPAILPVAVPRVLHHLVSHRHKKELVSLMNIKAASQLSLTYKYNRCSNLESKTRY